MKKLSYGINDIPRVASMLTERMSHDHKNMLALVGDIGAGKTTLVKKLLSLQGVDEHEVISPTFNYVHIYRVQGKNIYHFDLYRLASAEEFNQMGFNEYLEDENAFIIIEWPQIIAPLLIGKALQVEIDYAHDTGRELTIQTIGDHG